VLSGFALFVLLGATLAGLWYAFESDTFRVRTVTVRGADSDVEQAIEDTMAPGAPLVLGPNTITFSTSQAEQELARLPMVKSARVRAILPDQLQVDVTERSPEAAWIVGSDIFRVADDGMVIGRGSPDGLKVTIGQVAGDPIKPGDTLDMSVIKGAELLQDRLPSEFGITAHRIQYSPVDGLAVIGDQELIAMFGPPQDLTLKMAELQRVLQLAQDKKSTLAFVDLRYKTPYYRTR
jgi:cell division septal protein FtsQ